MEQQKENEKILTGGNERFVVYPPPPEYQDLWDLYIKHYRAFWIADEIDYAADLPDWNRLKPEERSFIEMILAFFAGSDGIVGENLVTNFASEVKNAQARVFYAFQAAMENIHGQTYAQLLDTLVTDKDKKDKLLNAIDTIPVVGKKAQWALKWMDPNRVFAERLVAFAVVEGIFFSGAFCSIFWLKDRNLMVKALGHSNEFISRDEALHVEFAVTLFHKLQTKPTKDTVTDIVRDAVEVEKEFILEAIPCRMIGMNSDLMSQYIEFVADRLLQQLGYPKIYFKSCPFDFMTKISLNRVTNFFEGRPSEYAKGTTTASSLQEETFSNLDF